MKVKVMVKMMVKTVMVANDGDVVMVVMVEMLMTVLVAHLLL